MINKLVRVFPAILPFLVLLLIALLPTPSNAQPHYRKNGEKDYLILIHDGGSEGGPAGYANTKGEIIVPIGRYQTFFSDTIYRMGIVTRDSQGFIGIDRKGKELFHVFPFDNGPDYPSEGLFRIIENGKIGYANENGKIIIPPKFSCAYPFEGGKAKVTYDCSVVHFHDEEHSSWSGSQWFYINKRGRTVK